jgi:hypothetical protein
MVFEILRSRWLAIIESTSLFLLILSLSFEVRLCKSSFAIDPQVDTISDTDAAMWLLPNATRFPRKVVSFRDDTSVNGRPWDSGPQKLFPGPKNYSLHEFAVQNISWAQITCLGDRIA